MATSLMRRCSEVWVNNTDVATLLKNGGVLTRIVSPWPSARVVGARDRTLTMPLHIVTTESNNDPVYGVRTVVDACENLIARGLDVRLSLLRYGKEAYLTKMPLFVTQMLNADSAVVLAELAVADMLIRATDHDGDSGIVREALACGTRVLASDIAPRPRGVELFTLGAEALAEAILSCDRVADGNGTGESLDIVFATLFVSS